MNRFTVDMTTERHVYIQPPMLGGRLGTLVCDFLSQLTEDLREVCRPGQGRHGLPEIWIRYFRRATNLGRFRS